MRELLFIHSLIDDAGLDAESFRVLCHVARRAGKDGVAFMGVKSAAKVCRMNKDTVAKRFRDLCDSGWLERVKRPGMESGFRLILPSEPIRQEGMTPIRQEGISDNEGYPSKPPQPIRREGSEPIRQEGTEGNPIKVILEGTPKRVKRERFDAGAIELPFSSENFSDVWKIWIQHRKEKRQPLTPTACKQQFAKFREIGEARAVLAIKHSVASGWTGVFEPKSSGDEKPRYTAIGEPLNDAARRAVAAKPRFQL